MATRKTRFGNPARQAEAASREQARALAAQSAAVAAAAQRSADPDCATGCCD
ncbi:hypothetical protein [uncultured Pseudokineococcus sp.]|uniref:hypothetical protein n=1 Tax=uncultured Pseudokineococcus sp. TaxID=1642928 RepID=UPI00260A38D2|nr:hypothetical protein [uncultured Pseudokineococcus sp.]